MNSIPQTYPASESLWISHRGDSDQALFDLFQKDISTSIKLAHIHYELLNDQSLQSVDLQGTGLNGALKDLDRLCRHYELLQSIRAGEKQAKLTEITPKLLVTELNDLCEERIGFMSQSTSGLLLLVDHEFVIEAALVLLNQINPSKNKISAEVHHTDESIAIDLKMNNPRVEISKSALSVILAYELLHLMHAEVLLHENGIQLTFKRANS